jgi:hypothetical protein
MRASQPRSAATGDVDALVRTSSPGAAAALLVSANVAKADKRVAFVVGNGAYKKLGAFFGHMLGGLFWR